MFVMSFCFSLVQTFYGQYIYKHLIKWILIQLSTKFLRMKSLSQRTIYDWNNLPANVVDAPSLNTFKNRLDEHWKNSCYTTTVIGKSNITNMSPHLQV